jgi:hypothetical protein
MAPLPPRPEDDLDKAQMPDVGYDLSYLSDQGGQRDKARGMLKKSKSVHQVQMDLGKVILQQPTPLQEIPVKKLKLKSNSVRDRMHPVGSLMLRFDGAGVAEFAEHDLPEVKAHMARRPGRYRLLEEKKSPPKKDHRAALEAARAALEAARAAPKPEPAPEPEPELTLEFEPAPEPKLEPERPAAKPKAKKKTAKKKLSSKKSEES